MAFGNGALSFTPQPGVEAPAGKVPECIQRPCPTSIDFLEPGMFVVNYRNEPGALRIFDPNRQGPDGKNGAQADGSGGRPGLRVLVEFGHHARNS